MPYAIMSSRHWDEEDEVTALSCVADVPKKKGQKKTVRSFWHVEHLRSGDYGVDCNTGAYIAIQALGYAAASDFPYSLNDILSHLGQQYQYNPDGSGTGGHGIEVGFLSTISEFALAGVKHQALQK